MLFETSSLPLLDLARRSGTLSITEIDKELSPDTRANPLRVARGLALLWHDHGDAAHEIAQSNEGEPSHDLLHAIFHRREGDFSNCLYWFRGAENHPCFVGIASRLKVRLAERPDLLTKLLPGGIWNPAAFVALVKAAVMSDNQPDIDILTAVQADELSAFYEWLSS